MKYVLILAILLTACGNDKKQETVAESTVIANNLSSACYERYVKFPGELFTATDLKKLTEVGGKVETDTYVTDPGSLGCESGCGQITLSWTAGRKNKWGTDDPYYVRVELSKLAKRYQKNSLEHFNQTYRVLTDEERKNLSDQMNKGIDEQVANGKLTQEQAEIARGFSKKQVTNKKDYEKVSGLGTAAVWEPDPKYKASFGQLYFLVDDYIFTVAVDVGTTDAVESKALAQKVAQQIISKCK
ncbi:MAG: hypothetical protein WBG46_12295 [Nonlabens sp.]